MTATDRKDPATEITVAMTEVGDDWRDLLWGEELTGLAEEVLGHACRCHRRDCVDRDAHLPTLDRKRPRESDQTGFRRPVVGLAEVAEEARGRRRVDDP